jgi:hypothetical protein
MANENKYAGLEAMQVFLENLKKLFATKSDLENAKVAVDTELSLSSSNPVANSVLNAEFEAIESSINDINIAMETKAGSVHDHNDLYYTIEQIDEFEFITTDSIDTICEAKTLEYDELGNVSILPTYSDSSITYDNNGNVAMS